MSMSDDDAAYSALLAQLLSDDAPSRNARVHSWIEHQYDFALSEHPDPRPPSPSPSSSLGARSVDRPDSPLLPRLSSERTASPCPSYDALFFPPPAKSDGDFEEQERLRALRFIVQEMAHWKAPSAIDVTLPVPPPSPASSVTQSVSSRAVRSRSSSTRMSRLPSFTSTLSSEQSQPQEIPPPLPVSVIVHGEHQHDLVLRPLVDGYLRARDDADAHFLSPVLDDKDSLQPSPTLSTFSCAYSRETSWTTPYASSLASPTSVVFSASSPENVALPASPIDEKPFFRDSIVAPFHERTPSHKSLSGTQPVFPHSPSLLSLAVSPPKTNVIPASPCSHSFPPSNVVGDGAPCLCAPKLVQNSQSRWSLATTASLAPSTAEPKPAPPTPPKEPKEKLLKTPKKRARFISLISRFSPGRTDPATATGHLGDDLEYDSADDSDVDDREKRKHKSLSKKSSLASLRASFSISRASFSSQRPPLAFAIEEAPPLPTSPTLSSPLAECAADVAPSAPLSRIPSRANLINNPLPPIPQSASTITTFQSSSQHSVSDTSPGSTSGSYSSLVGPSASASRISLLPPPSKRTSLASAAGIEPVVPSANQTTVRSKSIFRLTAKPKSLKVPPPMPAVKVSKLPVSGSTALPLPTTVRSRIPQSPAKFAPPAKLATVIATQARQAPVSPGLTSPTSKLPTPPSRPPPRIPLEKSPTEIAPFVSSRLPMPTSTKGARVGTVKGFWKRQ